jgi:hypothetical protein
MGQDQWGSLDRSMNQALTVTLSTYHSRRLDLSKSLSTFRFAYSLPTTIGGSTESGPVAKIAQDAHLTSGQNLGPSPTLGPSFNESTYVGMSVQASKKATFGCVLPEHNVELLGII